MAARGLLIVLKNAAALAAIGLLVSLLFASLLNMAAPWITLYAITKIGAIPATIFGVLCCLPAFVISRKVLQILERKRTDHIALAMVELERYMEGTVLMLILVGVIGTIAIAWEHLPDHLLPPN